MIEVQKGKIERELSDLLSAYLRGDKTLVDCAEWLSSVNWEEIDIASSLAKDLGELDLLCTETREGLRPESDFERKASELVATSSCIIYSIARPQILVSSSSTNAGIESPVLPF